MAREAIAFFKIVREPASCIYARIFACIHASDCEHKRAEQQYVRNGWSNRLASHTSQGRGHSGLLHFPIASGATQCPDLPPRFSNSRMFLMCIPRSTALHMSYTVSKAIPIAVNASISTPVRPTVSAVTLQSTVDASRSVSNSTAILVSGTGWQSGMSSEVRLDP